MVLFADIDGTLHPMNRHGGTLTCLPLLENVLRKHPGVDVVISSSWRTDRTLEQLRSLFAPDIAGRVIGTTPDRRAQYGIETHQRQREIDDWLREEGREYEGWLAIDDDAWRFVPGCQRLILVDSETGLTAAEAQHLCDRLAPSPG